MEKLIYEKLVVQAKKGITDLPMAEWPLEVLQEVAFDFVPEGDRLTVYNDKNAVISASNGSSKLDFAVGVFATSGFFRGYAKVMQKLPSGDASEMLALRVDDASNNICISPLDNIWSIETDNINLSEFLNPDDKTLMSIKSAIENQNIDFLKLQDIFMNMDIDAVDTELYLNYLNEQVKLKDIANGLVISAYFVVQNNRNGTVRLNKPQLTSPDPGRSFSLVGVQYSEGDSDHETILCVNVVNAENEYARVRSEDVIVLI